MPRIFDNIELSLLPTLHETLKLSTRADFCAGYFNLRGWKQIDSAIEQWAGGDGACCRLLIGMQKMPYEELRAFLSLANSADGVDQGEANRLKKRMAEEFRTQLMLGAPSNSDEAGLRRLSTQLKAKQVVVKLFLRHLLHAKLYLLYRNDPNNPISGFLGSSNLTFAGLAKQGELNVDVLDHDASRKLEKWFNERWNDQRCLDISDELAKIIDESWAREAKIPPYQIYIKMAYHLSQDARAGLSEFRIPREFKNLFEFQAAAVKIAAHHLDKRGGVLIGDVVGLGKTLMATALARIFEDNLGVSTLIICPKNLIKMWQSYVDSYGMRARVISMSTVVQELPDIPARFRLVLIDESQNLRNREGKRYRAIHEYIAQSESKCILLSATPYNKTYLDLSAQLRLFVADDRDLGIRPEKRISEIGETEFIRRHQCSVRSLAAFEKSEHADDWRDLMRLYLVRRTRSFIQDNYAEVDPVTKRKYLTFEDGARSYFPTRQPMTVKFAINDGDPADPYARLYASAVVQAINALTLPRYGLGNYIVPTSKLKGLQITKAEELHITGLSRAGKRLMGFCRTNLFKRLESGGPAFIQSIERHILRNYVFLHAIEQGVEIPLGTQDMELLDSRIYDEDAEMTIPGWVDAEEDAALDPAAMASQQLWSEAEFLQRAAVVYKGYETTYRRRFKWLRSALFTPALADSLRKDGRELLDVLKQCGRWDAHKDAKLSALARLLTQTHPREKVLIFTQFADTVRYLTDQLQARGIAALEGVTGESADPTGLAWRFSPVSNGKGELIAPADELRVLISTDVLSEGQNLQDCSIIINYDLPWAIIRLIQRAGRVDRIGQKSATIECYSFLPADGIERLIHLRARVRKRLHENAEVVGADETFFEDDNDDQTILNIYNEQAGILDGEADSEVDLASYAYQIWKNAIKADPTLQKTIPDLPGVVYSSRAHSGTAREPRGVLLYMRTAEGNDALAWVDQTGQNVTQSQLAILRAAECAPDTPALERNALHHDLVRLEVEHIASEEKNVGGQLGRPSGARFRAYERLKPYAARLAGTLFASQELERAISDIYRYPLRASAVDVLNRELKGGIDDERLAALVVALRADDRLCIVEEDEEQQEPLIICSLGLFEEHK